MLLATAEHSCVVMQTLRSGVAVQTQVQPAILRQPSLLEPAQPDVE